MSQKQRALEIFMQVDDIPAEKLESFLNRVCRGDDELRQMVSKLIAARGDAQDFLADKTTTGGSDGRSQPFVREQPVNQTIGPYRLLQKIGEGGFGVVYHATQSSPVKREVALKVIKPGMDSREVIARFESERQALAMMDHPNIACIFDAGQTNQGLPYFVMELVQGVPITDFCDKHGFNTKERLRLFTTVCHAVQHAHQKGVIHRDLKPSNIMVTLESVPIVKVIDFGVAKAITQRLTDRTLFTQCGQLIGTPQYMSPEQADVSGFNVDTRSDIYSLGVVLYELLTGTTPLDADRIRTAQFSEIQRIIQEEDPPTPSTRISKFGHDSLVAAKRGLSDARRLVSAIKGDLDWIVMKALDKRRDRRYETANELAADVMRHLNNEPVVAGRPTVGYRLTKWVQRNRVLFATTTTVLMALVLGLTVATWGFFHANAQRRVAREAESRSIEQQEKLEYQIYLNHIGNVDEAIQAKDYHRAQIELDLCKKDLRRWEWSFLKQRLDAIVPLQVPGLYVWTPVYSPDGKQLALCGAGNTEDEGKILIWDLESRQKVASIETESRERHPHQCALAGKSIAVLDANRRLVLWNTETKQQLCTADNVRTIAMTSDLRLIAVGDKTLEVFDVATGNLATSIPLEIPTSNWRNLSPDGRWVLVSEGERLSVIEVTTGNLACELPPNSRGFAFGPDDCLAFVNDQDIFVWNWNVDQEVFEQTQSWSAPTSRGPGPSKLSFGANGQHLLATGEAGNSIMIWEVATGRKVNSNVVVKAYTAGMNPITRQVAHPIHNDDIRVWNYEPQHENLTIIPVAQGMARFSPNGKWIAVADGDAAIGQVGVYDVVSGRRVHSIRGRLVDCEKPDQRNGAPWLPDRQQPDRQLLVVYNKPESRLEVWDVEETVAIATSQALYDKAQIWIHASNDGRHITTIERNSGTTKLGSRHRPIVRVWDIQTNESEEFRTSPFGFYTVWEDRLAYGNQIWDTRKRVKIFEDSSWEFRCFRFCADGKRLFRGAYGGVLSLYDLDLNEQTSTEPKRFTGHGGAYDLHYLVLSPDETQLLASDDAAKYPGQVDRAILWDVETALPLMSFEGEAEDWSSDNRHIALSTPEGVHIWTLPETPR